MLTEPGGPFIQLSRLNISKYASQPSISKPLFEYIYYHEHDVRYVSKHTCINQYLLLIRIINVHHNSINCYNATCRH